MEGFTGATVLTLVLTAALFFSPEPILVRNQAEVDDPFHGARHQIQKVAQESGNAVHATGEALDAVRGCVGHISEEVVHAAKEKVGEAVGAVQGVAERVHDAGAATVHSVKEATSHAVHGTLDSAAHARDKMVEAVKAKLGEAAGAAHDIVGGAAERVHHVGAATVCTVKEAASHTKHKVEDAVEMVEGGAQAAERTAMKAAECIKEIPAHAAHSASDVVHSVKDAVCHKVEEACKPHPYEDLKGKASGVYDELTEKGENITESLREKFYDVEEGVEEHMASVEDKARAAGEAGREAAERKLEEEKGWFKQSIKLPATVSATFAPLVNRARAFMKSIPIEVARLLHLIAFAVAFGASVWNIFVSGAPLSRMLSLPQFVYVQDRLFATYFKLTAISNALMLLSFVTLHPWGAAPPEEKSEVMLLLLNVLCSLINLFYLQPYAYRVERVNVLFMKLVCEKLQLNKLNGSMKHLERERAPAGPEEMIGARSVPATPPPSPDVSVHAHVNGGAESSLRALEKSFLLVHSAPAMFNVACFIGLLWHAWYLARVLAL